jgi:hypothetical protein
LTGLATDPPALISIVVPVFNEQATVAAVVARLLEIDLPAPREIIVVNDGSSDGTRSVLDGLPLTPSVTIVHSDRNRGKGHALRAGFARARGTVIAIQDADLELDPAQLASLVGPILDGKSDVIYGSRFLASRPVAPWMTIVANRALTALTNLVFGSSITDMETCYKIMRADVVRRLELTADRFDIEPEITARLLRAGFRIDERPVTFTPRSRAAGKKIGWRDAVAAVHVLLRLRPAGAFASRALLLLFVAAVLAASGIAAIGGFAITLGGLRLRAHDPLVPAVAALLLLVLAFARGRDPLQRACVWWWTILGQAAAPIACTLALMVMAAGWTWGTHVAGGSDSYCYLNEAELLASGRVRQLQPIAADVPWPGAAWVFVPAGHAPAPAPPGAVVPICPAGYPLMMAATRTIAGRSGMFAVVPVLGGLAVWFVFVIGRRLGGALAGVAAALLLAASPVFLYQVVQPMSDVPALALWLAALVFAWRAIEHPGARRFALSGAVAGAAVLVRPNLVPLAGVIMLWIFAASRGTTRARVRDAVVFGLALVPFALAVMAVQNAMYGGPLKSGYGQLGALFTLDHVLPNLARYPRWMLETETPFIALALLAPWLCGSGPARSRAPWALLAFAAATLVCYLPYVVFDAWWYLRFLLPGLAVILALSAAVFVRLVERLRPALRAPLFAAAIGALVVFYLAVAADRQVFDLHRLERRYRTGGEYVASHLPPNAAVLTVRQSGSVRYYSARPTAVWADLDPDSLDLALEFLRSRHYHPYLLFETGEEPAFRARFGGKSAIGRLEWPPIAEIDRDVRIYDPADYAPFMRGGVVRTDRVWTKRQPGSSASE